MKTQGDSKRSRSVKAEFDEDFGATALGGAVLVEKAMRSLGLRRYVNKYLPARSPGARYSMEEAVYALVAGLMVGGKGIGACEMLRDDALLAEVFGLSHGAPSTPTTYRVLCGLAGLAERKAAECYVPAGRELARLDMLGQPIEKPRLRRVVPDVAEAATPEARAALDRFTSRTAVRCAKAMDAKTMRVHDWFVVFGDATDLEVDGRCFDAARIDRHGNKILRWQTVGLGPVTVAQQLHEGNVDEGVSMPHLIEQAGIAVREVLPATARVLALLDAAYFEKRVIDAASALHWDFIVSANQQRNALTRMAQDQADWMWRDTGADTRRGWRQSQVSCFAHLPEGWDRPVTIVARRWIEDDDLNGVWRYGFVATRIEPEQLPKSLRKSHDYASAIWMLYSTKQGRENHYKTPLRDFGLHHPPSCRLGVNQAFYALATAASNIAMVVRYRVVAPSERGIAFWRLRRRYFQIAGRIVKTARRLTVRLAGANVDALRQVLWRKAFAAAGRL